MRLPFLKHLLDSVSALARPQRIVILGSSSLLPNYPDLGDPGQPLEISLDADFLLEPVDQRIADLLKDAVGHESVFEEHHGYYADILRPVTLIQMISEQTMQTILPARALRADSFNQMDSMLNLSEQ